MYVGLRDLNIFNHTGNPMPFQNNYVWQTQANNVTLLAMRYRRWYPTATTLADGRVLVTAGQQYGGPPGTNTTVQAEIPEVYNPTAPYPQNWQSLVTAARRLPLYPWMFQAPDGRVFNAGPNVLTGFLNTTGTGGWTDGPPHWLGRVTALATTVNPYQYSERGAGTAVMYQPGKILILGGGGPAGVTNTTELLNLNAATPAWQQGPPMQFPRCHANATLLANGTVLVTGGTAATNSLDTPAVLPAELWGPGNKLVPTGAWTTLNAMDVPRLYHSTAVLLPDATVLTTGGGQGGNFTDHPDYQIFTPPYLCQPSARPVIASAPLAVAYGQAFVVRSPDAANVSRATWVRLSSVTHSFNMNQLFMDLYPTYDTASPDQLTITAPTNPNLCPPGHYMLFLLNGAGVPSVASIMAVNTSACTSTLSISQTLVSETPCERVTRFALMGGTGAACSWTVDGVAAGGAGSSLNLPTSINKPTVQVRVEQGSGCGANAGLTSFFPGCATACSNCNDPRPGGGAPATGNAAGK